MNIIIPVSSLAKTSTDLVDYAIEKAEGQWELVDELKDVRDAVDRVERRSDSLPKLPAINKIITTLKRTFGG